MGTSYNIGALLRARAQENPDQIALRFMVDQQGPGVAPGAREISFGGLEALSDRYARGFAAAGLQRGDRTLVLAKPSISFYAFMFGLFKLGAVPVIIDPGMGMGNVLACIEQIGPRGVVALPLVHVVRLVKRRPFAKAEVFVTAGRRWFWGGTTLEAVHASVTDESPYELADFSATDEAAIIFTSGSTGTPKGVSLPHGAFATVASNLATAFRYTRDDVWMEAFAAFAFFNASAGMTTVIPDANLTKLATADPAKIVAAIQTNQCTGAFASPIVWAKVLRYAESQGGLELHSLQRVMTTGAPIQADMHRRMREVLREGVQLHTPYGATECLTVSHIASDEILGETWERTSKGWGTCVGRPYPDATLHIIAITDDPIPTWSDDLDLPVGEIGEIVAETMVASPEYKELPDATAAAKIHKGDAILHRMGDLGYLDEQGRLWFCGRKAHRLETADGVVPAVPVEGIFNEHPAVFRCALVGLGELGAERPVLLVELEQGHTWTTDLAGELEALASGTRWEGLVASFLPHPGFPVDARHNSKIRRGDLKAWLAANHAGR